MSEEKANYQVKKSGSQPAGNHASEFATSLREGESLQISKPDDGSGIVFTLHLDRGKADGLAVSWSYSYSEVEKQDDSVFFREAESMLKEYREFEDVWKEPRLKVIDIIRSQMPDTVNGYLPNGIRCSRLVVAVLGQQSDVESMRQLSRNGADKCLDWFLLSSPEEAESYQGNVVVFDGFWYQDTSPAVWHALTRGLCSLDFHYIAKRDVPPLWFRARIAREFSGRPSLLHGQW